MTNFVQSVWKKRKEENESKDTLGLDGQLILHTPNWVRLRKCKTKNVTIFHRKSPKLGRFPFVRTERPDRSLRNENFTFNKKLSSQIIGCTKEIIFQQNLLEKAYFIFKLTGRTKVILDASTTGSKRKRENRKRDSQETNNKAF